MQKVLHLFEQICKMPRCSKQEDAIRDFLTAWAAGHGFGVKHDAIGNLLITVPASTGQESLPAIVLQAHMDMVCEKTPASRHNFATDAIKLIYDGDYLTADQTTLGADNGIGLALAMALSEDAFGHPPLELLFTTDEESGLTGASGLDPQLLTGKTLINIDSEDEGVCIIGCAGGRDTELVLPLQFEPHSQGEGTAYKLSVGGLQGGHSGINIGAQRGNANVLLTRILARLQSRFGVRLTSLAGGSAHNAIPREAKAAFRSTADQKQLRNFIRQQQQELQNEYSNEPDLSLLLVEKEAEEEQILADASQQRLLHMLQALPDGVLAKSREVPGLVETSVNLATIRQQENQLHILLSQRSARAGSIEWLTEKITAIAALAGASVTTVSGYPGWQPNLQSELLERAKKIYQKLFDKQAAVEIIHAGLECGIIGAKKPGMDMISIGPTISNPHSPEERLHIPSLAKVYDFTKALIASYCKEKTPR